MKRMIVIDGGIYHPSMRSCCNVNAYEKGQSIQTQKGTNMKKIIEYIQRLIDNGQLDYSEYLKIFER